jgi:hypothetical protein
MIGPMVTPARSKWAQHSAWVMAPQKAPMMASSSAWCRSRAGLVAKRGSSSRSARWMERSSFSVMPWVLALRQTHRPSLVR